MEPTSVAAWRALPAHAVETNGITLHTVDHGEGPLVVLCHGFPELGFSWRHQVFALAEAGYRVLVPDMRGYGASSRPADAERYDSLTLAADLVGLLDHFDAERAVFIGHDWGAATVWNVALAHPDRVRAVAGLSVPPTPRPPVPPIPVLRKRLGEDFYMVWFQEPGVADAALAADVRRTLLAGDVRASEWHRPSAPLPPRPWLSDEEFEYFVETFERTGFTGGLNYYRAMERTWEVTAPLAGRTIDCPSMFLTGADDPVRKFMPGDNLRSILTDLREEAVIEGAGHWIQQERPAEVNAALLRFLKTL
jgi:pimeloyl-ACP methyl ester carboxylesterase